MGVEDGGNGVRTAQREKLRAAQKLLEIAERGLGPETMENDEKITERLSARQEAMDRLLAADRTLRELSGKGDAAGRGPEADTALAEETDSLLLKIADAYRRDAEEARGRMRRYQDKLLQLKAHRMRLSNYLKDRGGAEGRHFEAQG